MELRSTPHPSRSGPAAAALCLALLWACASAPPASLKPQAGSEKSVKGEASALFDDAVLHRVDIEIDPGAYGRLLADQVPYGPAEDYRLASRVTVDGRPMANVGIRGRGNSFDGDNKRSFKLKFDCTDPVVGSGGEAVARRMDCSSYRGRKYLGLSALNLRASNNDPTGVRELLAYKIFRSRGVPASRASLAILRVNGKSLGLYSIVENVDKPFLKGWFGDSSGDLYKCAWADSGGATFRPGSYSAGRYALKAGRGDGSSVRALIDSLAAVRTAADLEALFDKENLLAYDAVCALVGHWDSLNGNANNDYVYRDPADGKWRVVVWDTDNSFGSDWIPSLDSRSAPPDVIAVDAASTAVFCSLASRLWPAESRAAAASLLASLGDGSAFAADARRLRDLVKDAVRTEDPYLEDYGAFLAAFDGKPSRPPFRGCNIRQYRCGLLDYLGERMLRLSAMLK